MILLPVDEGYAFDYLAVLHTKSEAGLDVKAELSRVEVFLAQQITNLNQVLGSIEYKRLLVANSRTFEAIESAHRGKISARKVQEINHLRFKAKRELQRKFWPNAPILERKTRLDNAAGRAQKAANSGEL